MTNDPTPSGKPYGRRYILDKRLYSYGHQLQTALSLEPVNALEIGVGPGIISASLRAAGVDVRTMDINASLSPDIVGSVLRVPADPASFDVVLCCQVLEHLYLAEFPVALRELRRITRKGLVLSLPDVSRWYYLNARLPYFKRLFSWSPSFLPAWSLPPYGVETSGHRWEVGYKGCSVKEISRLIESTGWRIQRTWRVPEHEWHRFFDLRPA